MIGTGEIELQPHEGVHLDVDLSTGVSCWLSFGPVYQCEVGRAVLARASDFMRDLLAGSERFARLLGKPSPEELQAARKTVRGAMAWGAGKAAVELRGKLDDRLLNLALAAIAAAAERDAVDSNVNNGGGPTIQLIEGTGANVAMLGIKRASRQGPPVPPAPGTPAAPAGGNDPLTHDLLRQILDVLRQILKKLS